MSISKIFEEVVNKEEDDSSEDVTQPEVLDILNGIIEQEETDDEATHEEMCMLYALRTVLESTELTENILINIFVILDSYVNGDEPETKNLNEEFEYLTEVLVKRMVRGGKIVKRKKGYRKVGGTYKKIKLKTLRKMKRAARKRRHHHIKSAVRKKMKRTRKKVRRKFKTVLKRFHKINMAQKHKHMHH